MENFAYGNINKNVDIYGMSNKKRIIKSMDEFISEGYNPWTNVTYDFEVEVLFEGFEPSILNLKGVFESDKDALDVNKQKDYIDTRLKSLNSIIRYDIIKVQKSSPDDHIYPMM